MGSFLLQNQWLIMLAWGLVYLSDYYLTIYSARLFQNEMKEQIAFEGSFELTPMFQKDVDGLRLMSTNFLWRWVLSILSIPLIWWLSTWFISLPFFFYFFLGALFLREIPVHFRHIRNIALVHFTRSGAAFHGKIVYSRWFSLRLSAVEFFSFALFFLAITAGWGSWFFFGGAVSCLWVGLQHWAWSRKLFSAVKRTEA